MRRDSASPEDAADRAWWPNGCATFEGIRRAHVVAYDGTIRNSAYFSIIASEWPHVKQRLCALRDR